MANKHVALFIGAALSALPAVAQEAGGRPGGGPYSCGRRDWQTRAAGVNSQSERLCRAFAQQWQRMPEAQPLALAILVQAHQDLPI